MAELPPFPRSDADDDGFVGMGSLLWVAGRGVPAPHAPKRGGYVGSEWLVAASASEVLRRIVDTDPLHLEQHCVDYLRCRALVLDRERLLARLFAQVARASMQYDGKPPLELWLVAQLDRSADELLNEDVQMLGRSAPYPDDDEVPRILADSIGVAREDARRAATAINRLMDDVRRDFHAVVLQRVPVAEHAEKYGVAPETVRDHVASALSAVSRPSPAGPRAGGDPS